MSKDNEMDIPSEILEDLQSFHENLKEMQDMLHLLTTTNVNSLDVQLPSIDKARLNLISGYALNSLYWMYLNTLGEDPKHHRIKTELERYKSFMQTVKEITDKDKAPVLNKGAAKRFLRNALWEHSVDKGQIVTGRLPKRNKPSTSTNREMEEISDNHLVPNVITSPKIIQMEQDLVSYQNSQRVREKKIVHEFLTHTNETICSTDVEMEHPNSDLIPQVVGHRSTNAEMEHPNSNLIVQVVGHSSTNAEMGHGKNAEMGHGTNAEMGHGTNAEMGHGTNAEMGHGTNAERGHSTNAEMEHPNSNLIPQAVGHSSTNAEMEHPNSNLIPQAIGHSSTNAGTKQHPNSNLIPQAMGHSSTSAEMEHPNSNLIPQAIIQSNKRNRRARKKKKPILDGIQNLQLTETVLSSLSCGLCFTHAVHLKRRKHFPVFMTSCNHFFCAPCLWRKKTANCPTCQQPLENLLRKRMFLA